MAPVALKPGMPARWPWLGENAPMDQKELTPWLRLPDVINLIMLETHCQKQQFSSDRVDAKLLFLTIISQQVRLLFFIVLFIIKHYKNIDKTQNKRRKKPPKILPSYKPNCLYFFSCSLSVPVHMQMEFLQL